MSSIDEHPESDLGVVVRSREWMVLVPEVCQAICGIGQALEKDRPIGFGELQILSEVDALIL